MSGALTLAWPWALLALALPLLIRFGAPPRRHDALHHDGFARLWRAPDGREWPALLAWCALVLALCRPLWLAPPQTEWTPSRDLLLAVDLSDSMRAEDMLDGARQQSRLEAVRRLVGELIRARPGDRIGLIVFADHAYLLAPLTRDHAALLTLADELDFDLAGRTTAIGEALAVARQHRTRAAPTAVLLITDGRNTAGDADPLEQARAAAQEGLRLYTLGVGADPDAPLLPPEQRDPSSELDEPLLRELAAIGQGRYFRGRSAGDLGAMNRTLTHLEPTAAPRLRAQPSQELYPWPLALALLLLTPGLGRWPRRHHG
ncbi:VWA domain-containing protein [Aeromonas simiae]|uniref:VWA domain-containing protein n=1 Tax=Aeromonas simiae TaxID=218936 RepID=A0A5J6WYU3_9GAMM|nr:VWA domain-containing protein [Aeromonas simiae]QFI54505.1 VWA domain-containing protein [Aeromonas simiae]